MKGRDWVQPHQWGRILLGWALVAFLSMFVMFVVIPTLTVIDWAGFESEERLERLGRSFAETHLVGGSVQQLKSEFEEQGGHCGLDKTLLSCWKSEPGAFLTRFELELYAHHENGLITEPVTAFVQEGD